MKRTMAVIAVIGALIFTVSAASAWGPGFGMGPGYGRGPGWGPGWRVASLTAEERAQLDTLRQKHWTEMSEVREKIFAKRSELLAAQRAGDQAKVEAVTKELDALYAEHAQKRDEHRAEVAKLIGTDVPGPGYGPGFGPGMGRGIGPGMGRGLGMGFGPGYGPNCPMWQ